MNAPEQTEAKENRYFKMHPALLWSVIQSQAGSPEKALLEAIMNAVDAGASRCDITISSEGYIVNDDGRGFQSRDEIEQFFETFGSPHKENDATYGKFRMGRGQLFAFSKTTWRSSSFSMFVDIKGQGLSYDLKTNLPNTPGCKIEGTWYEAPDLVETIRITHDLSELAQWMNITVVINGKQINKLVAEQIWTIETEDAYILTKSGGGLAVYNMGALVRIYPAHHFGVSGTIVSKQPLQVNFARNDILISVCQVWKRIRRILDSICGKLTTKKTLMNYEREALAMKFARGEISFRDVADIGLLHVASGKHKSLRELHHFQKLCIVPETKDWTIGERLMNQKLAFVITQRTLDRFGASTGEEFLAILKSRTAMPASIAKKLAELYEGRNETRNLLKSQDANNQRLSDADKEALKKQVVEREIASWEEIDCIEHEYKYREYFDHIRVVAIEDISKHINDVHEILDEKSIKPHQKALLQGIRVAASTIVMFIKRENYQALPEPEKEELRRKYKLAGVVRSNQFKERVILIGKSDVAHAWTDGETFIAVNLDLIIDVVSGKVSAASLAAILLHEYCHSDPDIGGHIHSPEFYERFHHLATDPWLLESVRYCILVGYAKSIAAMGKKPLGKLATEIKRDAMHLKDVTKKLDELVS